jgi:hypothetical protein
MLQNSERKLAFMKYMRVVCVSEGLEESEEERKNLRKKTKEEEEKKMAGCIPLIQNSESYELELMQVMV